MNRPPDKTAFITGIGIVVIFLAGALPLLARGSQTGGVAADSADVVLRRYVDALGGIDALQRVRSRIMTSRMSIGWLKLDVETRQQWPDRFEERAKLVPLGQSGGSGYDGVVGWVRSGKSLRELQGTELERVVLGHRLDRETRLQDLYPKRRRLPDGNAEGVSLHFVEMTTSFGTREIWGFDSRTSLLRQIEGEKDRGKDRGVVKTITTFEDYREVDGIRIPFLIAGKEDKDAFTITVRSVKHNPPVEPIRFVPPDAPGKRSN